MLDNNDLRPVSVVRIQGEQVEEEMWPWCDAESQDIEGRFSLSFFNHSRSSEQNQVHLHDPAAEREYFTERIGSENSTSEFSKEYCVDIPRFFWLICHVERVNHIRLKKNPVRTLSSRPKILLGEYLVSDPDMPSDADFVAAFIRRGGSLGDSALPIRGAARRASQGALFTSFGKRSSFTFVDRQGVDKIFRPI